jgi:glutamine synthetase
MRDDCAVKIISEKNVSKLLFSLTGADVNPYFALYSLFTSIKSGLTSKYNLKDTLASLHKHFLPINLNEALCDFQKNAYLKSLFGEDIHQHYWAFYNLEFTEFMNQVDEWESNRYLYCI